MINPNELTNPQFKSKKKQMKNQEIYWFVAHCGWTAIIKISFKIRIHWLAPRKIEFHTEHSLA